MSSTPHRRRLLAASLNRWLRTPPRLHGEPNPERTVSFLELFYDLIFVVLVAQIAHHLAKHVSWISLFDFAVVFGLVWIIWLDGSLYHEVHGREDGRHRAYIFAQMTLLVVLAVFSGEATGEHGRPFAFTYAALLLLITYQWWVVYRHDVVERFRRLALQYIGGMMAMVGAILLSVFVSEHIRVWIWAGTVAFVVIGILVRGVTADKDSEGLGVTVTESMSERFGLFTIIVLGEVVVGVVNGIADAGVSGKAIAIGLFAMGIAFGFWWNYFDLLGRREPRSRPVPTTMWLMLHLPLHGTIAAAGAGMVGLIEYGSDKHLHTGTAWLLAATTAMLLALISLLLATIGYPKDIRVHLRKFQGALWVGAVGCLTLPLMHPVASVLALCLSLILMAVWAFAFYVLSVSGWHEQQHGQREA